MENIELKFRQGFLQHDYYLHAKALLDNEIKNFHGSLAFNAFYNQFYLEYTAGSELGNLLSLFECAVSALSRELHEEQARGYDYVLAVDDATNWSYTMVSLCILLNRLDLLDEVDEAVLHTPCIPFDSLIRLVWPDLEVDTNMEKPYARGTVFRKNLTQAINATSESETLKYLKAYVSTWYDNMKKYGMDDIDSHHNQSHSMSQGGYDYVGYWCFEAAAVAYLKDINDTELHEFIYYPKDIVQYAREQRPL